MSIPHHGLCQFGHGAALYDEKKKKEAHPNRLSHLVHQKKNFFFGGQPGVHTC